MMRILALFFILSPSAFAQEYVINAAPKNVVGVFESMEVFSPDGFKVFFVKEPLRVLEGGGTAIGSHWIAYALEREFTTEKKVVRLVELNGNNSRESAGILVKEDGKYYLRQMFINADHYALAIQRTKKMLSETFPNYVQACDFEFLD